MKDDTKGVAIAGENAADAVPRAHAICASCALYGPLIDGKYHRVVSRQVHDFGA